MSTAAFIGTFDPMHGAHIGQLLRARRHEPFEKAYVTIAKHPEHKPNAAGWQHRIAMAELALGSIALPFRYEVVAVENALARELDASVDYRVTGLDSFIDDVAWRLELAQRWPMVVMSVPGMAESELTNAIATLPADVQPTIRYEYVSEDEVPIMNYDFDSGTFISRRIHATYLRAGQENSLIPPLVRDYIAQHGLYASAGGPASGV